MVWTAARWTLGAIGIALLAGALFSGSLGIRELIGFGPTYLAALLAGLAAVGAALAGKRVLPAYGAAAVLLMNTVLMLSVIELGAALLLRKMPPATTPLPGESSPYYREKPWASAYWREFHALRHSYHPYFLWRARPFQGKLINIDSNGLRAIPGAQCISGAYQVATFGGSTLWGWGEPDSSTLAAQIQAELASASSRSVCVRSFAQLGSNSTQDLIQLLRELQAGRIPDLVIFYSGINEIVPPFGYGVAGAHFDLRVIGARLEGALDKSERAGPSLRAWLAGSSLWRLFSRFGGGWRRPGQPAQKSERGPYISPGLADSIVSTFMANVVALDAVAAHYGFRYEVFWQPNVAVGRKPLTPEEQAIRAGEKVAPLAQLVYSRMSCVTGRYEHLHDIRDVFAGESALVYLDWHHLNSIGNRVVARAIARTVAADTPRTRPSSPRRLAPRLPVECMTHPAPAAKPSQAAARGTRQP